MKDQVANWGNYPKIPVKEQMFSLEQEAKQLVNGQDRLITRGNGRCYGDASLSDNIVSTLKYNKILAFDEAQGILTCQAGVTLAELLDIIVPRGWFLPVTPGTKFITVGGAVASDVHGKNHHAEGAFSNHVLQMDMLLADGTLMTCGPQQNTDLFEATCGGMGLTGMVLHVTFRLKKIATAYIKQRQIKARNLDEAIELFAEYQHYTYSMAWIDCLKGGSGFGRSILMMGEHALPEELPSKVKEPLILPKKPQITMPFDLPSFVLNPLSIKAFNFMFYNKNYKREMNSVVPYEGFFYPLDAILHWNRMYGKQGFVQYQFVLPLETSRKGLVDILARIREKGWGSFLAVLKLFGKQDDLISFPMEGYTLALDFPIRKGLFEFLDELDKVVLDFGGRIYLSKDARMKPFMLTEGYPHIDRFMDVVRQYNPDFKFGSMQSQRLEMERKEKVMV